MSCTWRTTSATRSASSAIPTRPGRELRVIDLRPPSRRGQFVYPYDVRVIRGRRRTRQGVCELLERCRRRRRRSAPRPGHAAHQLWDRIRTRCSRPPTGRACSWRARTRDTVSVIDTRTDRELARIGVGLGDAHADGQQPPGARAQRERARAVRRQRADAVGCRGRRSDDDVFPASGPRDDADGATTRRHRRR